MPDLDLNKLERRALEYLAIPHAEYKLWNGVLGLIALVREQQEKLAAKDAEIEQLRAPAETTGRVVSRHRRPDLVLEDTVLELGRRAVDKLNVTRDPSGDTGTNLCTLSYNEKGEIVTGAEDFGKAGL